MKHSELTTFITKQKGKTPTQQELADILGLTKNAISSRAFRDKEYSYSEVEKLENYYNISFSNQAFIDDIHDNSGDIVADYYLEVLASCGGGTFELSQVKEKIRIPKMCIVDYYPFAKYSVINAYGDSMRPDIKDRDLLIVRECENGEQIRDNQVYVFFYNNKIFVKRLVQSINKVIVVSDNPDKNLYPTQYIEREDMNNIHLIGRIVGLMRGFV